MAIRVKSNFIKDIAGIFRQVASTWVNRDVRDEDERTGQAELLARLLVAAMLFLTVLPSMLLSYFGLAQLVPIVLVVSAIPMLLIGILARTGYGRLTAGLALGSASIAIAALAFFTGGLASPFLAWTVILPTEAFLLGRNRKSVVTGLAAMLAVFAAVAIAEGLAPRDVLPAGPAGPALVVALLALYGMFVLGGRQERETPTSDPHTSQANGMLDRLPGLVTFHDEKADLKCIHGSDAAQLLKYVGDLSGGSFVDHIHVSDRLQFLQGVDRLRTGAETVSLIVRLRSQAGDADADQFRHWSTQLAALRDEDGRFDGFIAQSRDITSEIELRRSYVRKVVEAEAANEAKTRFLAAVSHELRTPLNAILGFSDILTSEYCSQPLDDSQAEYVGLIRQSGQHLLAVINSMLDLSKIDAGRYELNLEPFDMRDAFRDCEAMLRQQAKDKNIVLTTRVAKGHEELTACRRAVQQILINLIANAIKFTDEGGVVTVDGSDLDGYTRISVSDTGIGMSEEDLKKVGAPFVQVQAHNARQYEGTGLGLSLVKGLVALHHGRFSIESSPGVGTTVTVDLPNEGPDEESEQPIAGSQDQDAFPPRLATVADNSTEEVNGQAQTA